MCYSIFVKQDLKRLKDQFNAEIVKTQFEHYESMTLLDPKKYRPLSTAKRVYPNYFAPVVTAHKGRHWILPMRYRVRPEGSSEEVPAKYNLFNARLDSLTTRTTWKKLFGFNHGVVSISEFYEWVEDKTTGKKKIVGFSAKNSPDLTCPVLWDWWKSPNTEESFFSFAIITGEPPQTILDTGHDRCPLFLNPENLEWWLNPQKMSQNDLYQRLHSTETYDWQVRDAAP
jgi:putative SOS response-associated peptidase YedK